MANRETYPAAQSPLRGDISGQAGETTVTVTGIQHQPVEDVVPVDQDTLRYIAANSEWEPTADGNSSVRIGTYEAVAGQIVSKGTTISDDYDFLVNNISLEGLIGWAYGNDSQVFENGSPI
jgi:hypothetical protein